MTDFTKIIFDKHEIRKTRKQKDDFIRSFVEYADSLGYKTNVEKGSLGAKNIIVGSPEASRVVFTAHYDTCAVMPVPNFITPKNMGLYLLYQIFISLIMLFPSLMVAGLLTYLESDFAFLGWYVSFLLTYILFIAGRANKHTANDNTSGVTVITDLMKKLPDEAKSEVAFILFDFEEAGLLGSSSYNSKHKKEMKDKLLINFDCVSDGNNFIFALQKGAIGYKDLLEDCFKGNGEFTVEVLNKGIFYPSDQMMFKCGVGVAALKRTAKGTLYMDRIHTKRDTVYQEENIEFLVDGCITLVGKLRQG